MKTEMHLIGARKYLNIHTWHFVYKNRTCCDASVC